MKKFSKFCSLNYETFSEKEYSLETIPKMIHYSTTRNTPFCNCPLRFDWNMVTNKYLESTSTCLEPGTDCLGKILATFSQWDGGVHISDKPFTKTKF